MLNLSVGAAAEAPHSLRLGFPTPGVTPLI
jgi:hypothetical protein